MWASCLRSRPRRPPLSCLPARSMRRPRSRRRMRRWYTNSLPTSELYPFLSKATVPRGAGDLAKDLPPADVTLFASKASLVVRKDLHPRSNIFC